MQVEEESHQCLPFPQSRPQPVITPGYCSGHGGDGGDGGGGHGGGLVSDYGAPQSGSSGYTAPATEYGATGAGSGYIAPAVASAGYSAPSGGGYSVSGGGAVSSAGYADTNLTPDTYGQPIGEQSAGTVGWCWEP